MSSDYNRKATLAACLLMAACAASFGERHLFAALIDAPEALTVAFWCFMAGLLTGGWLSDRLGVSQAILVSVVCLAAGALVPTGAIYLDLLTFGGGIALAVSNGLVVFASSGSAGRWLNFTHAFYRGGTLVLGFLLISIVWLKWLSFAFALMALLLIFRNEPNRVSTETGREKQTTRVVWKLPGFLALIFMAGATELWFAHQASDSLIHDYPRVGLLLACAMFLGRLAASLAFFSGYRQLITCSVVSAVGLGLFDKSSGESQLIIALAIAFFSASLFPSTLGLLRQWSGRWTATLLAIGQFVTMMSAPLAAYAGSYAIYTAIVLSVVFVCMWASPRSR